MTSQKRKELQARNDATERRMYRLRDAVAAEITREAEEDVIPPEARARTVPIVTVRAGIRWLAYHQEEDAVVSQFGITREVGCYRVTLTPDSILIFEVLPEHLRRLHGPPLNPMTEAEVSELRRIAGRATLATNAVLPGGIEEEWNGAGCTTVSLRLRAKAEPDLQRAYRNYLGRGIEGPGVLTPEGWS